MIIIGIIDIHTILKTSLKPSIINPVSEYTEKFSGSALHTAANASVLKADVGIISVVGRDAVGLMDVLRRYQIDYSHLVLSSKKNANFIEFYTKTRHYNLYYEGAIDSLQPEKIEKEYLKRAKAVHVCFPDSEVTDYVVQLARKENILTSVDAAFSESDADIVFMEEGKQEKGKGKLKQKEKEQAKNTILMNFEKGITANKKKIPVFRGDTYYKNGVKDAFVAAFLTRYIKTEHMEHSALYGSCAAYICSQSRRKVLTCTKEEVDDLFDQKMRNL